MDASPLKKLEQLEFSLDSVTDLSSSPPASPSSSPAVATFSCVDGVTELRFLQSDSTHCFTFDLASAQLFKLGTVQFICVSDDNSEEVIKGKVEDIELPEKADVLISEPMGTLLVNERMLESYVIARDRFMSPNGKMFPTAGRIHMAPFSDEFLFIEMANKALFWQQQNYYGVDLTPLFGSAHQGYFSQPVVDAFDPRLLVSPPTFHTIDFTQMKEEDFYEIDIPLKFTSSVCTRVHGLACWFDVLFDGSTVQRWLTTAPGAPTTHWYQIRCVLAQPIYVMAGQEITGRLHLVAHSAQSYTIDLTLSAKMWGPGASQGGILQSSTGKFDLKEPYYRMSQPQAYPAAQEPPLPPQPQLNPQDIQIQSDDFEEELLQKPAQNASTQL
ncbi:hypothetical protein F2Q68_00018174 [Brassica cretica]|uniref:type I protein arginine methyltransferase n=1 Tax=Brassica cretica TaxID=69181 RepID=A0A8S9HKX3_BRACR|nr:hypothetical protein F2Q68_00018174 [Brassica cretica]